MGLPTPPRSKDTQTISVKCSQTRNLCTETTGISIRNQDNLWSTATSTNPRTGSEPEKASTPGNAEVHDNAKVKAGATVMTPAKKFTSEALPVQAPRSFSSSIN